MPLLQEWEAHQRAVRESFVRETLRPARPDQTMVRAVSALLDFSVFKSFQRQGTPPRSRSARAPAPRRTGKVLEQGESSSAGGGGVSNGIAAGSATDWSTTARDHREEGAARAAPTFASRSTPA